MFDVVFEPLQVFDLILLLQFDALFHLLQSMLSRNLNVFVINLGNIAFIQTYESTRLHPQKYFPRASAQLCKSLPGDDPVVDFAQRNVFVQDSAFFGDGKRSLCVVSRDHAHRDPGYLALLNGLPNRTPEWVLDAHHTLEHLVRESEAFEWVPNEFPVFLGTEVHLLVEESDVPVALVCPV